MKTPFETDEILFALLNGNTSITGGVYLDDDRPDDSESEDIVINTIDLEQDAMPQIGTSNVNIYTPDTSKSIGGKVQLSANKQRLKALSDEVLNIIRNATVTGLKATPGNMTLMSEPNVKQHFVNIRIDWNIVN